MSQFPGCVAVSLQANNKPTVIVESTEKIGNKAPLIPFIVVAMILLVVAALTATSAPLMTVGIILAFLIVFVPVCIRAPQWTSSEKTYNKSIAPTDNVSGPGMKVLNYVRTLVLTEPSLSENPECDDLVDLAVTSVIGTHQGLEVVALLMQGLAVTPGFADKDANRCMNIPEKYRNAVASADSVFI